jgi:Uma2 family endonuclease
MTAMTPSTPAPNTATNATWTPQGGAVRIPDDRQPLSHNLPMESSLHYLQLMLLVGCLDWLWRDRTDFFIGANLTIYFSPHQIRRTDFRGPDFFLVKNTEQRPRNSWVVWEEQDQYPSLIIELLSTAKADRTIKKALYQDRFQTPEYFWFSPRSLEFAGFRLGETGGETGYAPIEPNPQGWRWSQELDLYLGVQNGQLRYFSPDGKRVPTPAEAAQQQIQFAQQQTQLAQQQTRLAQQQTQLAEHLAAQLRALGVEPDSP